MATSSLPLDICANIINEIALDMATLKACSLACQQFTYYSQRQLFSAVAINAFPLKKYPSIRRIWLSGTPAALKAILKESPHLARHIRSLIILDQYYFPQSSGSDTDGRTAGMTWLPRDHHVPDILPLLQDLISLEVHFGAFAGQYDWRAQLTPPFLKALLQTLRLPSLTTFLVSQATAPVLSLLRGAGSNLKTARIGFPCTDTKLDKDIEDLAIERQSVFLESLQIRFQMTSRPFSGEHLPAIQGWLSDTENTNAKNVFLSRLRRLEIVDIEGESSNVVLAKLLGKCAPTLKTLVFNATLSTDLPEALDVSKLVALERIRFRRLRGWGSVARQVEDPDPVPMIGSFFHNGAEDLEEILIELVWYHPKVSRWRREEVLANWNQFADILSGSQLPKLKMLRLIFHHPRGQMEGWLNESGFVRQLESAGIQVKFELPTSRALEDLDVGDI